MKWAKLPCKNPLCANKVTRPAEYCDSCKQYIVKHKKDHTRMSANDRGYGRAWQRERAAYLADPKNALCVMCLKRGKVTAATVVDHIIPHKGDYGLFWDKDNNWQALCKRCHDSDKQREERG
jgi:5-methylcytosine-specific restriction protein A